MLRHAERTRARAAAAVRNCKRLVQVEMHEIEAHIARPCVAHQCIGIRAIVIAQAAGFVHRARYLVDVVFKESERIRIGHHHDGGVVAQHFLDFVDANAPALVALERDDFEAAHGRRRRIRAVRRVGNDNFVPLALAATLEICFSNQQRCQLGMRARRRIERKSRHAEERAQAALELPHDSQRALRLSIGSVRMQIAQTWQARHRVVHARIVFHRARAERIEADVDSERALRKPRKVPHHVHLAVIGNRQLGAQRLARQKLV